ncbi:hypothetical protein COLO4_11149 [Corchorus olitorius]|uniref:Uncharacterized protein n=1 Tax=Corchorus olitorius TaxID=93759 RepID=A0A1R3K5P9_9ROSI|nr:hypothetical protein COLO4_11149 [Corchorus olitorius]
MSIDQVVISSGAGAPDSLLTFALPLVRILAIQLTAEPDQAPWAPGRSLVLMVAKCGQLAKFFQPCI